MAGIDLSINFGNTERQSKSVTRAMNEYLKSTGQASDETEDLRIEVAKTTKVMPALKNGLDKTTTAATNFGKAAAQASSRFGGLAGVVGAFVASAAIRKAVNDFVALDKGLIGVSKTTGIVGKDLQSFEKRITSLSKEVPVARETLLDISQAAGQLGVEGSDNIVKFTKVIAQLGSASNLSGEEAATTLARMIGLAGETVDSVDSLGSAIVALGNNMKTNEAELAAVALQVAQATTSFHVASSESAAFGAALRELGVQAELGGSAVGRTFRAINSAILGGGKNLEYLSKVTGIAGDKLQEEFEKNSVKVFQAYIEGLGKAINKSKNAEAELEKLGLRGEELNKVIPTLAMRSDVLAKALGLAAKETKNATALISEAEAAGGSYAAQLQVLDNRLTDISSAVGKELVPVIIELSDKFASFLEDNKGDITELAQGMGSLASSTGELFGKVLSGFNELPDSIKSIGVIGSIFFGAKGAALFAGFNILYDWADTADKAIARVLDGSMAFSDFAFANGEELRAMLKELEDETTRLSAQAQSLRSKAARSIYQEDKDYYISEAEKLELEISQINRERINSDALAAIKAFDKVTTTNLITYEDFLQKRKKLEEDSFSRALSFTSLSDLKTQAQQLLTEAIDPLSSKIRSINKKYDSIVEKINQSKALESDKLVVVRQVNSARDAEIKKLREAAALKEKEIEKERILKEIRESGFTDDADIYEKRKEQEEKAFEKALVERNKQQKEKRKNLLLELDKIDGTALKKEVERLKVKKDAAIALAKEEGKDVSEIRSFYNKQIAEAEEKVRRDSLSEWERWGEDLTRDVFASVAYEGERLMSDVLFAGITGELNSFEDIWDSAWKGIVRTFTDSVAKMASEKIVGTAIDFAFDAIFAKDGLWEVEEDGQKVVAHKGEMVVPENIATRLRDMASDRDFDGLDKALAQDVGSVYDGSIQAAANPGEFGPFGKGMIKGIRSKAVKNVGKGIATSIYGDYDMSTIMQHFLGPESIGGMLSAGIQGGATSMLGLDSYWASLGGFASMASALLSGAAGGPIGMIGSAVLGTAGSAALDFVGDAVDGRSNEPFRDSLEDPETGLGIWDGKGVAAGVISGSINPSELSEKEYFAVKKAIETQKGTPQGLKAFEENSFMGFVDSVFTTVGDIIDFINPFTYIGEWLGFTQKEPRTLQEYYDAMVAIGAPRGANTVVQDAMSVRWDQIKGFADSFVSDIYGGSSYNAGLGTAQGRAFARTTGTNQDWSGSAKTSSHSSRGGSKSSYDTGGGLGGNDFGLADGGIVNTVLAANPRDDGYVPMQMGEYVIKRSSAQSIGSETLDVINQTGSIPSAGPSQVVVNFVTSSGQQLKQFVVDTVRDASERNVATIHASGIYGAV